MGQPNAVAMPPRISRPASWAAAMAPAGRLEELRAAPVEVGAGWASEAEIVRLTASIPRPAARATPLALGTRALRTGLGAPGADAEVLGQPGAATSSASRSCGTHFGWTNEVTSSHGTRAPTMPRSSSSLISVGIHGCDVLEAVAAGDVLDDDVELVEGSAGSSFASRRGPVGLGRGHDDDAAGHQVVDRPLVEAGLAQQFAAVLAVPRGVGARASAFGRRA